MTIEALSIAGLAYLLVGGLVALWLVPVRETDTDMTEMMRSVVFLLWWLTLLYAATVLAARGARSASEWWRYGRHA